MKQTTLATNDFEQYRKPTRRDKFRAGMNTVVPWADLVAVIEPHYPKTSSAGGRPPVGLERMLRIHCLQLWFDLSDPAVEEALYDSRAMRSYVGIDLGREPVPDKTTVMRFRHLLEEHKLGAKMFEEVGRVLQRRHAVAVTPANTADCKVMGQLLHGQETRVYGDQACKSQKEVIRAKAPKAKDFTNRQCKWKHFLDEAIQAKNRNKSRIRARVEHSIGVIKRVFGFTKGRYRGLAKNGHRVFVTAALANIFLVRYTLLGAVRPQ